MPSAFDRFGLRLLLGVGIGFGLLLVPIGCKSRGPAPGVTALDLWRLRVEAIKAQGALDFDTCNRLFDEAKAKGGKELLANAFEAAACHSAAGRKDEALAALERSLRLGLRATRLLEQRLVFAPLRDDPRWAPVITAASKARLAWQASLNAEILEIYQQHTSDWATGGTSNSGRTHRDVERRRRIQQILARGDLLASDDLLHAAMVLEVSSELTELEVAHDLALRALGLDANNERAKLVAATAKDRGLVAAGKPQRYGTQSRQRDGRLTLAPIAPGMTDEERVKWNVAPLADLERRIAERNAKAANAKAANAKVGSSEAVAADEAATTP